MAENNIENNVEAAVAEQPENKKNGFRIGYLFLSFIPFSLIMVIQTAVIIPGIILSMVDLSNSGQAYDFKSLMLIFNQKYAMAVYLIFCAISIAVFFSWYYIGFVKKDPKVFYKKSLGIKPFLLVFVLIACLYFVVTGAFTLVGILLPEVIKNYSELMALSSLGANMWITVIYGIILGPIVEELCFRGVAFRLLEKSGLHFILVIVIQAAMFGIAHANAVQSLYTFGMGMVFGFLRYKYKTIFISIVAHMLFNFSGTIVATKLGEWGFPDNLYMLFGVICAAIFAAAIIVIAKDKGIYSEPEAEA